jgi:disulfide bond formation protein DsbB
MSTQTPAPRAVSIDPRGPRFTAYVTGLVLAVVLLTAPSGFATALLGVQAALFAVGAALGVQHTPLAWLFRTVVRPRLAAPDWLEDAAPPRFAQAVGLGFALVGLVGFLVGVDLLGLVATGLALVAALLNAVFGLCLGCEMYLLIRRVSAGPAVGDRDLPVVTTN